MEEVENMDEPNRKFMKMVQPTTQQIARKKVGRNEICPCGSGKKFKKCCLLDPSTKETDA